MNMFHFVKRPILACTIMMDDHMIKHIKDGTWQHSCLWYGALLLHAHNNVLELLELAKALIRSLLFRRLQESP